MLTLCDKPTLCQQIERTIAIQRNQVGDAAFALSLLNHANEQQKILTPGIYETYYQTIVGDNDASPPRDGYLQKSGLDVALKEAQATAQTAAAAAPVVAPAAAPAQAPSTPPSPPPVPSAAPAAPPIPADSQWYYAVAGQQRGPVGLETVRELAATGLVSPETNVWCQGMPAWAPAISTPLAALFETATTPPIGPPPLPPL